MILVRCSSTAPTERELDAFIRYANTLKNRRKAAGVELLLVVEDADAAPVEQHHGQAIKFETQESLLDGLVDWTDYRNEIRRRVTVDQLPDSKLTISQSYVSAKFEAFGWVNDGNDDVEQYRGKWLEEPGGRQVARGGVDGLGKCAAGRRCAF